MDKKERKNKTLAENRKARHDYFIEEVYEAGIELIGTEVKSIRMGKANLKESYAEIKNGEIYISGMHISPYEMGNIYNRDPLRRRKLLMHKNEILKLDQLSAADGYTLIPLSLYLKNGRVKIAIAVAKGKKNYDKRDSMLEKAHKRDMDREFKERNR
jgi:SsrA-binding protein